ncbi:MAG TPA: CRISPR-associated protein Cas5 [Longimicrobiaceae bacterium]|nr:CRISPR-associated protein Cas5 [Longimicrobiaceae bacterium]
MSLEIAAPLAMFTRPDTGGTPTSYPVPTWSACKGIFESIAFFSSGDAWINPTHVEVCRHRDQPGGEVRWQRYTTNYGGPLRKSSVIRTGSSYQLFATVLADVCYRIYGEVLGTERRNGTNARHHLKDVFERRLRQGKTFRTPALGWKEFTASYWGSFREDFIVDEELDLFIPAMLHSVWERSPGGRYAPTFHQNVRVRKGVLRFAE